LRSQELIQLKYTITEKFFLGGAVGTRRPHTPNPLGASILLAPKLELNVPRVLILGNDACQRWEPDFSYHRLFVP